MLLTNRTIRVAGQFDALIMIYNNTLQLWLSGYCMRVFQQGTSGSFQLFSSRHMEALCRYDDSLIKIMAHVISYCDWVHTLSFLHVISYCDWVHTLSFLHVISYCAYFIFSSFCV